MSGTEVSASITARELSPSFVLARHVSFSWFVVIFVGAFVFSSVTVGGLGML